MQRRMGHLGGAVSGPRPGRMRRRRRAPRGPLALPGPLSPASVPVHRTPREHFDALVGQVLAALDKHFTAEPDHVDVVVEEVPLLPAGWTDEVPHSALVRTADGSRVILYRVPLTQRCRTAAELEDATWRLVLDRLAEVWQLSPDDIDPRL